MSAEGSDNPVLEDVHHSSHDSDTVTSGPTEPPPSPMKTELAEHVKEQIKAFLTTQDSCCEDEVEVDYCSVGLVTETETDCPFIFSGDDSEAKENVEVSPEGSDNPVLPVHHSSHNSDTITSGPTKDLKENVTGTTMSRKRGCDSDVIIINLISDENDDHMVKREETTVLRTRKRKKYRRICKHKCNSYDDCGINADDEGDGCEPPEKHNVSKLCCCGKCSEEHTNSYSRTSLDTGGQGTSGLGTCYCHCHYGYSAQLNHYTVRCCGHLY